MTANNNDKTDGNEKVIGNQSDVSNHDKSAEDKPLHNIIQFSTNVINDNLILFRYTLFSSIVLISAYGLAQTRLFFRFRSIQDIPSAYFRKRKKIYGRLVHVLARPTKSNAIQSPITCLFRHQSPIERLLPKRAFDHYVDTENIKKRRKDIIRVELAGVVHPPIYHLPHYMEQEGLWLKQLASNHPRVTLTLVAEKKILQSTNSEYSCDENAVVGFLAYRPASSLLRKDLSSSLVKFGRADISNSSSIVYKSNEKKSVERDLSFMDLLRELRSEAILKKSGMWADENVRRSEKYQALVEKLEVDRAKSVIQRVVEKVWRKLWSDN